MPQFSPARTIEQQNRIYLAKLRVLFWSLLMISGGLGCSSLASQPAPAPVRGVVYITVTPARQEAQTNPSAPGGLSSSAASQITAGRETQNEPAAGSPFGVIPVVTPVATEKGVALLPPAPMPSQPADQPAQATPTPLQPDTIPPQPTPAQPTLTPTSPPSSGTMVSLQAAVLQFPACTASQITTLNVSQVNGMQGFAFKLHFDPDIVAVVDADPNQRGVQISLGDTFRSQTHFVVVNTVDPDNGQIEFAAVTVGSQGFNGDAVLAQIEWAPHKIGRTPLTLAEVNLAGGDGNAIQTQVRNGSAEVLRDCSGQAARIDGPPPRTPGPLAG